MQTRQQELLGADTLHFVAQDALQFAEAAPAKRQQAVQAGAKLANEARSQQQLM